MSDKINKEATPKKGKFAKLQDWFAKPGPKQVIAICYSVGAAIVIVGALFKIMHWPGAGTMLTVGMLAEVVLFLIGVFDKPHVEYHWQNVYPELLAKHDEHQSIPTAVETVVKSSKVATGGASSNVPTLSSDDMNLLSEGVRKISETANQFADLTSIVAPTNKFAEKINAASAATEEFLSAQTSLSKASHGAETAYQTIASELGNIQKFTANYSDNLSAVNGHLSSINTVYELQLKNIQLQTELFAQQNEKISVVSKHIDVISDEAAKLQQDFVITAKENELFKNGVSKLSEQVTDLNKIYGNMLNALS